MKKIFTILILSLGLQGCLAGAFVAGGATTGSLVTDPRPISTIKTDEEINFKVNRRLVNDPELNAETHISAISYNRVVLLTGQAYDEKLKAKAEHYARSIPEVRRVFNKISLGIPTTLYRRAQDVAITSAVKTKMFANRDLKSNDFKIVTENGVVYILGIATPKQARLAVSVARDSSGVKKVVKLIEYREE
ncbi:BON domain-containing protein [Rickettsiella grylli]|uniref:BON domain-containing protein n=1 Tax=Rickettsiella grylli TaxID=59196 RepID=UPI0008FD1BA1|nr:BON domain-containing protein [Rickettsiella grylli]OIZ99841.1 BON domain-containing protein [Rickettsiella grylli]